MIRANITSTTGKRYEVTRPTREEVEAFIATKAQVYGPSPTVVFTDLAPEELVVTQERTRITEAIASLKAMDWTTIPDTTTRRCLRDLWTVVRSLRA